MNILVFGAAGGTGQELVRQAASRGHRVTAFVRRADSLAGANDSVRIVVGDATMQSDVAEAMDGQDAVISALGVRNSFRSGHLMARSMKAIVPSMEKAGVARLIVVSAFGVGESRRDAPLVPSIMYSLLLRDIFADKKAAEDLVRASGLEWTILYPVLLTNGPRTTRYRTGERLELRGVPKISRADVAHFALSEAEKPAFARKVVAISY